MRFACDAMLGGVARWLRAYGYDAWWRYGVGDAELVERAAREGRVVLTADRGMMARRAIARGGVGAFCLPHGLARRGQLAVVIARFGLVRRPPRCMGCGGALHEVPKGAVAREIPPRTAAWLERYWRCGGCGKLYWRGTHWERIQGELAGLAGGAESTPE